MPAMLGLLLSIAAGLKHRILFIFGDPYATKAQAKQNAEC